MEILTIMTIMIRETLPRKVNVKQLVHQIQSKIKEFNLKIKIKNSGIHFLSIL